MSDELVFYTNPMSRGRIVRWMLEEAGCNYRTELLDFGTSMKEPAYLAINPMGKVPALRHGSKVITECAAICAYLAEMHPDAELAPPPNDRADYYRWLFYFAGPVEAAVSNRALGLEVPADKSGTVGYGSFDAVMDTIEIAIADNSFIAGDAFTAADVYCGSQIGWGLQFGTVEDRPAFRDYWARLESRPAYSRAKDIDDALLASAQT